MRRIPALVCFLFAFGLIGVTVPLGPAHADVIDEAILDYRLGLFDDAFVRMRPIANADHPHAMFWIGKMYETGRGTERNLILAHDFYKRAALLNDADAQNNIGLIYKYAKGQERDLAAAMAWFSIAAARGHRVARDNRDITEPAMTEKERSRLAAQISVLQDQIQRSVLARQSRPVMPEDEFASTPDTRTPPPDPGKSSTGVAPAPRTSDGSRIPDMQEKVVLKNGPAPMVDRLKLAPPVEPDGRKPVEIETSFMPKTFSHLARSKRSPVTGRSYVVQVGIFRDPSNVERIRAIAASNGIDLDADQILVGGRIHARVRHGDYMTRNEAVGIARRINRLFNVTSMVVRRSH